MTGNGEISIVNPRSVAARVPDLDLHVRLAPSSEKAAELRKFIYWAITAGQKFGPPLLFAPLPKPVLAFNYKQIKKIQTSTLHDDDNARPGPAGGLEGGRLPWRFGDIVFYALTAAASLATLGLVVWLSFKVVAQAWGAIEEFGLSVHLDGGLGSGHAAVRRPPSSTGRSVTAFIALLIATPVSIAIALFLTELAPRLDPRAGRHADRAARRDPERRTRPLGHPRLRARGRRASGACLQRYLGFLPIFSGDSVAGGLLPAALVLTLMIVPITSSICRELFSRVPRDLSDGALALGATAGRRSAASHPVRGPRHRRGRAARPRPRLRRGDRRHAGDRRRQRIHRSLFATGDTLASRIASEYQGAVTGLQIDSLLYLAAILLVISLVTNVAAQAVVRRFERSRGRLA